MKESLANASAGASSENGGMRNEKVLSLFKDEQPNTTKIKIGDGRCSQNVKGLAVASGYVRAQRSLTSHERNRGPGRSLSSIVDGT